MANRDPFDTFDSTFKKIVRVVLTIFCLAFTGSVLFYGAIAYLAVSAGHYIERH